MAYIEPPLVSALTWHRAEETPPPAPGWYPVRDSWFGLHPNVPADILRYWDGENFYCAVGAWQTLDEAARALDRHPHRHPPRIFSWAAPWW